MRVRSDAEAVAKADALVDSGIRAQKEGRLNDAVEDYAKAIRIHPKNIDANMNLGCLLAHLGQQQSAIARLQAGVELGSAIPEVWADAATSFLALGRWDLAQPLIVKCVEVNPRNAVAYAQLAYLHMENGRREDAIVAAKKALKHDPRSSPAAYTLYRALYDDRNPRASLSAMRDAVKYDPSSLWYQFSLGVLLDQCGDSRGAQTLFEGLGQDTYRGAVDSWEYIKSKRGEGTRILSSTRDTLRLGLQGAQKAGLTMEFGVRFGISTRWIAEESELVHGFDSFQGLPETWHVQPKGIYSTHGEPPTLPPNVKLHVGWFDSTLPTFRAEHGDPIRFMNVDCDLYTSTKTIFDQLADRVISGTVIVFDEYLINDAWRQDEYKAFQEFVAAAGIRYEYLAFSVTDYQAVVRIL